MNPIKPKLNIIRRPVPVEKQPEQQPVEPTETIDEIEILDSTYQNGKIYILVNEETDEPFYVGSTTMELVDREYYHRWTSEIDPSSRSFYKYLYPYANSLKGWYIDLYENYPCRSKKELNLKEGQVIKEYKEMYPDLCNHQIPGRTRKEYYDDNQDQIIAASRAYYEANKDTINRPVICECGATTTANSIRSHQKTSECKKKRGIPDNMYKCKCGDFVLDSRKYNHNRTKEHLKAIGEVERYIPQISERVICACGTPSTKGHLSTHMKSIKCREFHMTPEEKAAKAEKERLEKIEYDKGAAQRADERREYKKLWKRESDAKKKAAKEEAKKSEKK